MRVGIFNNKGGVGKTTYLYHLAHVIASNGKKVLLVDADPQCNLTAYCLQDNAIERSWAASGNSIFRNLENLHESLGDIKDRKPTELSNYPNIWIVPGDPALSNFEDVLADTWNRAKGGSLSDLRKQTGVHRYVKTVEEKIGADITFIDMGPNLGPLNRTALTACDYFVVPVAPDLFSIRGTENLGNKLLSWQKEWRQIRNANENEIDIPPGTPVFLGYVRQQYNVRNNETGMTRGWSMFGGRVEDAIQENIVEKLKPFDQILEWEDETWDLGSIPNLHSLVPYSQEARKPIFDCTGADGVTGTHLTKAKGTKDLYLEMASILMDL